MRPRWSSDPSSEDAVVLPRDEYQLLLAAHAQRVAGEWARALRHRDEATAARCVAQLRALSAAGIALEGEPPTLDPEPRAIVELGAEGVRLFTGDAPSLWEGLRAVGRRARQVDIVVAYAQPRGVQLLAPWLEAVAGAEGEARVRILVGTYLNGTSIEALHLLLGLSARFPRLSVRLLVDPSVHFHPKIYRVLDAAGRCHLFVGSSNLSFSALTGSARDGAAVEWNLGLDDAVAPGVLEAASARLEHLLCSVGQPLTEALIAEYEAQRPRALPPSLLLEAEPPPAERPDPRPAQLEALSALARLREQGSRRALVVAATGLGKTVLAALDSLAAARDGRVLFLAHRERLLLQARDAFARLRPEQTCGLVHSTAKELDARHLFVSVGSAHHLRPADFQYVVIDEAHHSAAPTYRKVLEALPAGAFVLGLTATPERLDGGDIYELFDNVVAYEVGLLDAIGRQWLVPFHYFGLRDTLDFSSRALRDFTPRELEARALGEDRMSRVVQALQDPRYPGARTLAFCVSIAHARAVAARLSAAGVPSLAVHSGPSSPDPTEAIEQLRRGVVRVLCVVDLFNEGVDIPEVDRVAFLRPTDSPTVFLQQLGRGLRVAQHKTALVVVDFVANHRRAELRPEWLGLAPGAFARLERGAPFEERFADGRSVYFEPAAVDVLRALGARGYTLRARLCDIFDRLREEMPSGQRPRYRQFLARCGLAHGTVRSLFGSWAKFVADRGAQTTADRALAALPAATGLLDAVEQTELSGPHKMLLLGALAGARRPRLTLDEAEPLVRAMLLRHPAVLESNKLSRSRVATRAGLAGLLRDMPVKYLVRSAPEHFRYERETKTFEVVLPEGAPAEELLAAVEELAEARLFDVLRRRPCEDTEALGKITLDRKRHALWLDVGAHRARLPAKPSTAEGVRLELRVNGAAHVGWLHEGALRRVHAPGGEEPNAVTAVLQAVVGADTPEAAAGRRVRLRRVEGLADAFELLPADGA